MRRMSSALAGAVMLVVALAVLLAGCDSSAAAISPTTIATLALPSPLSSYSVFVTDVLTGNMAELGKHTWHVAQSIHGLGLSADSKMLYVTGKREL